MRNNKIGAIFMISVISLAGVGISYASWIDDIYVSGTVTTGQLDLYVVEYSGWWVYKDLISDVLVDSPTEMDPDSNLLPIAHSYAYQLNQPGTDIPWDDHFGFEFVNLFPCPDFEANIIFHYKGIPAKFQKIDFTWHGEQVDTNDDGTPDTDWWTYLETYFDPAYGMTYGLYWCLEDGTAYNYETNTVPAEYIKVIKGDQIHECMYVIFLVWIHLPQEDILMNLGQPADAGGIPTCGGSLDLQLIQFDHYT